MCDLVKKSEGGAMFLLSRGGVHWHGGSIGMGGGGWYLLQGRGGQKL